MIYRTIAILLVTLFPLASAAQQSLSDIQQVIRSQLQAFEKRDLEGAFSFASPNIKTIFQSPKQFGQMVEQGYPMVWKPSSVRFGPTVSRSGADYQVVVFRDSEGRYHALEYEMIPTEDGWKINGVRFVEMPDVGA
ncbi:DUF4864 domain-containing protein [Tropicimonas sp. TH_r6]|uniref:DUF4864 domain-containing protein n=1 Tax=Tropicimonas sp. TH_r6 TaxID=3082085 RepID=UPI0029537140|nr:DUF4864 domain-containing protein [Tropicimonas sp. TH_r6]MDV7143882.1 DUF4864 domain-containing protein [Tropicimonas sp. TH_r6]